MFKETDRKFKETDRKFKETDLQFKETDRKIAESIAAASKEIQELSKITNKLQDKWGRFVEYFVAPGIPKAFQLRGIPIHQIYQRAKAYLDGAKIEIDVLGINAKYALLVSVKSTLSVEDVNDFLEDILKFKEFFPQYVEKKLIGAVAGIDIKGEANRYAYKKGLYVIGQSGDSIEILNDLKFKPKEW
jgi:hypothetical protein